MQHAGPMHAGAQPLMRARENYGVRVMSFGFFLEGDEPVVWRGPMVNQVSERGLLRRGGAGRGGAMPMHTHPPMHGQVHAQSCSEPKCHAILVP